jgi:hypothetical protein
VPASWEGFGALLASAGERAPADALTLAAIVANDTGARPRVDLSGMWALPAEMAPAGSAWVNRALDDKGRLQLPVQVECAVKLPAERDGALVTVFLPDAPEAPRPTFAVAAQPLDARGRLTLSAGLRREAGIPDSADVLAVVDPDRRTVTLTAASRLQAAITAALDGLRRSGTTLGVGATNPADTCHIAGSPAQADEQASDRTAVPGDACEQSISRRLRIVS